MQPWAEVHPNSRRAKALVCYQGEAGSNTTIVPCETDASLAGRFPVSSSSSFFSFYKAGIKRVREKSLLAFALAERKFPPPNLSSYTVRPGQENETFFYYY